MFAGPKENYRLYCGDKTSKTHEGWKTRLKNHPKAGWPKCSQPSQSKPVFLLQFYCWNACGRPLTAASWGRNRAGNHLPRIIRRARRGAARHGGPARSFQADRQGAELDSSAIPQALIHYDNFCRLCLSRYRLQQPPDRSLCDGSHLVIGAVLDGMSNKYGGRIISQGPRLRDSGLGELAGGNINTRYTPPFQGYDVVHTARRARASIGQGFDHDVAFGADLLQEFNGRHAGKGRLLITMDDQAAGG